MTSSHHVYEVRPRKDKRGFDLISGALPFGSIIGFTLRLLLFTPALPDAGA
jgi:hypothetical protein